MLSEAGPPKNEKSSGAHARSFRFLETKKWRFVPARVFALAIVPGSLRTLPAVFGRRELYPIGAGSRNTRGPAPVGADQLAGLRMYPAPRIVWIMGSRPSSIFLRRYEM